MSASAADKRKLELGSRPIPGLLLKFSAPAIIGMMVNSLYNLVDAIFVGQGVGALALAGLTVSFPLQMTVLSVAITVGVGSASILSRALGANDDELARRAAGSAFFIIGFLGLLVTVLGLVFLEPLLWIFGATEAVMPYARDYMSIIFIGSLFYTFTVAINHLIRAEGHATFSMIIMLVATGLNLILDPIFIFVLNMGIGGAAIATVISLITASACILYWYTSGRSHLRIALKHVRFNLAIIRETFAIGSSTLARSIGGSLMAIALNNSINFYGQDIHLAIIGATNRLLIFTFLPMIGLVQGLQPIIGFNYGARKFSRVWAALRLAIIVATVYCVAIFAIVMLFAGPVMGIFGSEAELTEIGSPVLRILTLLMPFLGFQVICASYFQSIGKAGIALFLGSARQILFLVPLILILPNFFGLDGIWYSVPLADLLATASTAIWVALELRHLRKLERLQLQTEAAVL